MWKGCICRLAGAKSLLMKANVCIGDKKCKL
jgi:hypothetical protein